MNTFVVVYSFVCPKCTRGNRQQKSAVDLTPTEIQLRCGSCGEDVLKNKVIVTISGALPS